MNSLRSISDLPRLDRQPIAVGAVCLALTQSFSHSLGPLPPRAKPAECPQLAKADVAVTE
jgi:hypothetical protein